MYVFVILPVSFLKLLGKSLINLVWEGVGHWECFMQENGVPYISFWFKHVQYKTTCSWNLEICWFHEELKLRKIWCKI